MSDVRLTEADWEILAGWLQRMRTEPCVHQTPYQRPAAACYRCVDEMIARPVEEIVANRIALFTAVAEPVARYVDDIEAFYSDDEDPFADDILDWPTGGPDPDETPLRWSDLHALRAVIRGGDK